MRFTRQMQPPDDKRIAEFLAVHQGIVCKIARSFACDTSDYDDLFQEICIGLWAAFDQIPEEVRESTYVYRVALNRAISWRRKRNSYLRHLTSFWRDRWPRHQNPEPSEHELKIELLYTAIRRLSDSDRCLVLLYLDEMSAKEIAQVLGSEPATVRKRVSRVKRKLAEIIRDLEANHDC